MKKLLFCFSALTFILFSCEKKTETIIKTDRNRDTFMLESMDSLDPNDDTGLRIDEHNSKNSVDWSGTYHGTLPCADCEGIKTELTLNKDETYQLKQEYLTKNTIVEKSGKFVWSADGEKISITVKDVGNFNFKVGENRLFLLDQEGNEIAGNLAENYILNKK